MFSNVSSEKGPYSSSGSKGVIEVPSSDVKLSVNMRHILKQFPHDDTKQKREVLAGATADLHKRVDELAREKDFIEDLEHVLGRRTAHLYEEVKAASKTFHGKVAGIKEYLEKKGVHDLDSTIYTSDEIKASKDPRKLGN